MNDFQCRKLGEILSFISKGTTPPRGEGFVDIGVNYIKSEAIGHDRRIDKSKIVHISQKLHNEFRRSQLTVNDILFSMAGVYLGKNAIVSQDLLPANTNQALAILRIDNNQAIAKFVSYYLSQKEVIEYVNNISGQSAQPNINFDEIKSIPINLPTLSEQHAIVSILCNLDNKIDILHRQNATLEKMAETLFRQWFIVEAKDDWKEGKILDIINVKSGFPFKSSSFVENGMFKLVTIKAVQDGYLTLNNADSIQEIPDNVKDYCFLNKGDILLSLTGNVGRCCLVDRDNLILNQRVSLLQPIEQKNWAFIYTLFRMESMKSILEETAKGTAQPNLSPVELSNMSFIIPPNELLNLFSIIATPLIKKILSNRLQIHTLERLRDTLLPKLMSGEIRVKCDEKAL